MDNFFAAPDAPLSFQAELDAIFTKKRGNKGQSPSSSSSIAANKRGARKTTRQQRSSATSTTVTISNDDLPSTPAPPPPGQQAASAKKEISSSTRSTKKSSISKTSRNRAENANKFEPETSESGGEEEERTDSEVEGEDPAVAAMSSSSGAELGSFSPEAETPLEQEMVQSPVREDDSSEPESRYFNIVSSSNDAETNETGHEVQKKKRQATSRSSRNNTRSSKTDKTSRRGKSTESVRRGGRTLPRTPSASKVTQSKKKKGHSATARDTSRQTLNKTPTKDDSRHGVIKPYKFKRRTVEKIYRAREMRKGQKANGLNVFPRAALNDLIREVIQSFGKDYRVQKRFLELARHLSHLHLSKVCKKLQLFTYHRGRITTQPKDMKALKIYDCL